MNQRLSFVLVGCVIALGMGCGGDEGPSDGCPEGMICFEDGAPGDAGGGDATTPDSGPAPGCMMPQPVGQIGGTCRGGTMCVTGLDCYEELLVIMGSPITVGNVFDIPEGTEDPANPGEYIAGADSDVPIPIAPGGQCTRACDTGAMADMCGDCATCSTSVGGSPSFPAVGITISIFDVAGITNDTNSGICRQDCVYDPATNGGCPSGYTCDVSENVCIEACVADSQCNLGWGISRTDGLVTYQVEGAPFTCNTSSGRCEWTPDGGAAVGSPCDDNTDCPADIGICLVGAHCSTYQCNVPMADGMTPIYPCPDTHQCITFGSEARDPALCVQGCTTNEDCWPSQSCRTDLIMSGDGVCWFNCLDNTHCRTGEACLFGLFADETVGRCFESCDPADPVLPTGVCETDEVCLLDDSEGASGADYFCRGQDNICFSDLACNGTQACRIGTDAAGGGAADDLYGRCEEGCEIDDDCDTAASEECVIFDDLDPMTPALARGVCRAPGEPCSPSPTRSTDMSIIQPMRGDNQCISTQECDTTTPDDLGNCVDRL